MTVFGRSYAHTGLSQPMKTVVLDRGAVLTLGDASAILRVPIRGIDRCFTQRGKPQGLSRFLHGRLHVGSALQSARWFARFMHGAAQRQHLSDHPHLRGREVLNLAA